MDLALLAMKKLKQRENSRIRRSRMRLMPAALWFPWM